VVEPESIVRTSPSSIVSEAQVPMWRRSATRRCALVNGGFVNRYCGRRAAIGAIDQTLPAQLIEVAAHGLRRYAETRGKIGDAHGGADPKCGHDAREAIVAAQAPPIRRHLSNTPLSPAKSRNV